MISLSKVKAAYQGAPKWMQAPLQHIPFSFFLGKNYSATLRDIQNVDESNGDYAKTICAKRALEVANQAIRDTPFYRDLATRKKWTSIDSIDQFLEFPVISSAELAETPSRFANETCRKRFEVSTGGTTGKQTHLWMANSAYAREWAYKSHYLSKSGIDINSRRLCLRGVDFQGSSATLRRNPLYKELLISPFRLSAENVVAHWKDIESYSPKWLHGYPSAVSDFASIIERSGLRPLKLNGVLLVSEKLFPDQEEIIRRVLSSNVLSFYGMTERVIFAGRDSSGIFHPYQSYGLTEVIDGQLVGTGFLNEATRLLRYATGDKIRGTLNEFSLSEFPEVEGRWGREYLVGKSGVKISMTALNIHSEELSGVRRYQFFQDTPGVCELRIQLFDSAKVDVADLDAIAQAFQRKSVGELDIIPVQANEIDLSLRGKHVFIRSELI